MRNLTRALAIIFILVLSGCSKIPGKATKKACFKGQCINLEVVWKQEEMARGLQNREKLNEDSGMLFIFEKEQRHRFWMKDTLIPLDIIWINSYREVVNMALYVPPCTQDPCPFYQPNEDAKYVLEMNAGKAKKLGLEPGDRISFK